MKSSYRTLLSIVCASAAAVGACATGASPSPLNASAGAGGDDTSSNGGGTGNGQTIGVGGSTSSGLGGGGGAGGSCKMGGMPCQLATDCCSSTCENQLCTACAGSNDACMDGMCCKGLSCNDDLCGTCKGGGTSCTLGSDCCTSTCEDGMCTACGSETCLGAITKGAVNLCGAANKAFAAFHTCACGPCMASCTPYCSAQPFDQTCEMCLETKCMTDLQACEMN